MFCLILSGSMVYGQSNWLTDSFFANYPGIDEQIDFEVDWSTVSLFINSSEYNFDNYVTFLDSFPDYTIQNGFIDVDFGGPLTFEEVDSIVNLFDLFDFGLETYAPSILIEGSVNLLTNKAVIKRPAGISQQDLVSGVKRFDDDAIIEEQANNVSIVCISDPLLTIDMIQQLDSEDLIDWGQPDFRSKVQTFNIDPLYGEQYQLKNTGQLIDGIPTVAGIDANVEAAWTITTGTPLVHVAIIDDGIEVLHEDLDILPSIVGGFTYNSTLTSDYHGMAVAGLIGAKHNDKGIKGVAPNVFLSASNIFDESVSISDIANLFYSMADLNVDVINNSWGFVTGDGEAEPFNPVCAKDFHPAISDAITYAATHGRGGLGTVIVFSSGNSNSTDLNDHCVAFPANHPDVISVGAITPTGQRAMYSSVDSDLDFVVPSSAADGSFGVVTVDKMGVNGVNAGNYNSNFGGTSAAAPIVSGIVALMLSVNSTLTLQDIKQNLIDHATDLGEPGHDNSFGYGLPDAFASVNSIPAITSCPSFITLAGSSSLSLQERYSASSRIRSSQNITSDVTYAAGDEIELLPDFSVTNGFTFLAKIEACD